MKATAADTRIDDTRIDVDDFFVKNYNSLARYCHAHWNGSGQDVLHGAWEKARKRYQDINFDLFTDLALEASREKAYWYPGRDGMMVIVPRTETTRKRLATHFAAGDAAAKDYSVTDEMTTRERKKWIKKITSLKTTGMTNAEIIAALQTSGLRRRAQLKAEAEKEEKENLNLFSETENAYISEEVE